MLTVCLQGGSLGIIKHTLYTTPTLLQGDLLMFREKKEKKTLTHTSSIQRELRVLAQSISLLTVGDVFEHPGRHVRKSEYIFVIRHESSAQTTLKHICVQK